MAKPARPDPPKALSAPGKRLWRKILSDLEAGWELDARERHLLERACRTEDELRKLEAVVDSDGPTMTGSRGQTVVHPCLAEARQLRLLQARLLGQIEMNDPRASSRPATPAQARGRRAAEARWGTG